DTCVVGVGGGGKTKPAGDEGGPYLIGQLWSGTEGNPAVRNLREDDGDVGIIRSPIRAIVLPDPIETAVRNQVRQFIEGVIEAELDEALARPRYRHRVKAGDVPGEGRAAVSGHR